MRIIARVVGVLVSASFICGFSACPKENDSVKATDFMHLKVTIEAMQRQVEALEGRVSALEGPDLAIPSNPPDWVKKGSGIDKSDPNILVGVGSVSGITNPVLAQTTADNRAREQIAQLLRARADSGADDRGKALATTSAIALAGVDITAHWTDPESKVYALAKLNLRTHPQVTKPQAASKPSKQAPTKASKGPARPAATTVKVAPVRTHKHSKRRKH